MSPLFPPWMGPQADWVTNIRHKSMKRARSGKENLMQRMKSGFGLKRNESTEVVNKCVHNVLRACLPRQTAVIRGCSP